MLASTLHDITDSIGFGP